MATIPTGSADYQKRNPHVFPKHSLEIGNYSEIPNSSNSVVKKSLTTQNDLVIVISGQITGGKNNMIVTRSGRHFPKASWAKWRDDAVRSVKFQLPKSFKTITDPVNVRLTYVSGDNRRRDQPAILDAIWHVLEKAGVVSDDTLLWVSESSRGYDKNNPRTEIEFLEIFK